MKKIIYAVISLFLLVGCSNISNTPTRQVENFFNKYQTLDNEVLDDLDKVINESQKFNDTNKEAYREVIKKQYKNMTYKIKEETIDGDNAVVAVEITVLDFGKVIKEVRDYKNNHIDKFQDENSNYDDNKYINYLITRLKETKEKVKYTLDIKLTKLNEKWKIDEIDNDTEDKILGIYER